MVLATFFSFWRTLIWIWLFDFFNFLRRLVKKTDILPDRKRCPPPLYGQLFVIFLVFFWPYYYDYICSERDFTQEWIKSISMQLLESQIPPLTAAALPMIICKSLVPPDDHLQDAGLSGWSFARGQSLWIIICKRLAPLDDHLQEAGPSG